jgi:hypothetical protein
VSLAFVHTKGVEFEIEFLFFAFHIHWRHDHGKKNSEARDPVAENPRIPNLKLYCYLYFKNLNLNHRIDDNDTTLFGPPRQTQNLQPVQTAPTSKAVAADNEDPLIPSSLSILFD